MIKKDYFKGWYFKCSTNEKTIAFIPAYHCNSHNKTASLQIITDNAVFDLRFDSLKYREKPLTIKIGNCSFSEKGINLDIKNDNLIIQGNLSFSHLTPIAYDIMGPFKFVPLMQCRHSVYSMKHKIDGTITVNGEVFVFQNGIGYLEGDRGNSFPKEYIWTQCHFENGSLMLSVADIPLLGFSFTGIIGVIILNGKEHRIATYLGAKLNHIGNNSISVKQGDYSLSAKLIKKNPLPLYAPNNGKMNRTIYESASCTASYSFSYRDKKLYNFTSEKASFEFEYT